MGTDSTTVWGIDLGTTYSCIARVDEFGHAVVINNREGDPTTPSVVMIAGPGDVQVGKEAKRQMQLEPDLVCELVKRYMGDPAWHFAAHGEEWTAAEMSAHILRALAEDAAMQAGEPVERVVITVPAYFGVAEREATIAAGTMAGLEVVDVLNEPTAAALSYGFAQGSDTEETVVVYDLGGGTFDITVIRLESTDGGSHIRVVATGGNHRLGGADWDARVVQLLAQKFQEAAPHGPDPLDDEIAVADLRLAAEEVKRALTLRDSVTQFVMAGNVRASVEITREEFEESTRDLLEQTLDFTRDTVEKARELGAEQIDRVLLVGGSSFMPAVQRRLAETFEGWAPELQDPNQAVARGAALFGFREELRAKIAAAAAAAGQADGDDTTEEIEREVAAEAGVPLGTLQRMTGTEITNVCSRGFGVKVLREGRDPGTDDPADFYVDHLIEPNTPLPVDPPRVETYYTTVPNQSNVQIVLMEQAGTDLSQRFEDNAVLEQRAFHLPGDDPAHTEIEISLGMEGNGVLTVVASHPRVPELSFSAASEGAVLSPEQIAMSGEKVRAMRRA